MRISNSERRDKNWENQDVLDVDGRFSTQMKKIEKMTKFS